MRGDRSLPPAVVRDAFRLGKRPLSDAELRTLGAFGRFTRAKLEPTAFEIDRGARPVLREGGPATERRQEVVLSPDHVRLLDLVYASGIAVGPVGGAHDWPFTFALMHEVADVGILCSLTVTLATVHSLEKWGAPAVRDRFLPGLLEAGGRAQGATWATEEQGGSDLGANQSRARLVREGEWALTGEKFFCSNVGASCAVVTARPEGGSPGVRGIRLYFLPANRRDGRANWRVRRLKEKLGTVTVPTGEVCFEESEAYPLGPPEVGALPVMEMLNLSRVANAIGCAAVLNRAFEVARAYAQRRQAFGKALAAHPLLGLDLATLATEGDAASLLALDSAFRFDRSARERPPYSSDAQLMRFSTHVAKLVTAEQAVRGAILTMEILGGVGYLEELPVAKLVRDALVTPIWEGGANIHSIDARELRRKHHPELGWRTDAERAADDAPSEAIRVYLSDRLASLEGESEESDAKRIIRGWGEVRQMTLLTARALMAKGTASHDARAELFARLHSGGQIRAIPLETVERALAVPRGEE